MKFWKKAAAATGIIAVAGVGAGVGETAYFYRRTMKRNKTDVERAIKMSGTDWSQYAPIMEERKSFMLAQPHSDIQQISYDGLRLHATYFAPINDKQGKKRAVICFHGYTSEGIADYIGLSDYYLKNGYAMLLPDARAHGSSEGEYVGFGCLDRKDALVWINWIIGQCGEDVEIVLHGTSMGGATVLMASGLDLPSQVKGIVSDCGFTSPKEVFTHVLKNMYHLPAFPVIPGADILNRRLAGYGMDECNAKREVKNAKVPILFIHGSNDNFVPAAMCDELYECCSAPKRKLIVEGASHAESYYKATDEYENALNGFFDELVFKG